MTEMKIEWHDGGREPRCKPNPKYPNGIDLDNTEGAAVTCKVALPYPAKRCGVYIVECSTCGLRVGVTAAGRPDDPRSIKLACHRHKLGGEENGKG